ncbi:c-type cytochrome [Leucothrix arctica]|uniref:Cytochrome c5 family protein n=1 Tax=Leucothrix arctica TaxID=1481894 RepID=A0A317CL78_9GAMM|nr:c-type cytochrome [Leucothrix arctica]PWQ98941.1 cytochrome c5 family protein [Leucothrix arctica]
MAGSHEKLPRVFWVQIALVLIVGLFYIFSPSPKSHGVAEATPAQKQMIVALEPIGNVEIKKEAAEPGAARAGGDTVKRVCAVCHSIGLANAPKLEASAKADWETRMAGDMNSLVQSAITGKGGMPARGGDPSLTDEEMYAAVADMLSTAGIEVAATAEVADTTAAVTDVEAPVVEVAAIKLDTVVASALGESTYKSSCFACHDTGAANSPIIGDKIAWAPRLETGVVALHASALKGKGAMPAKGGNPTLSDEEVIEAVNYIIANSK